VVGEEKIGKGLNMGAKNHQQKWQRMAKLWEEFTEPGRPSKDDISHYNALTKIALKSVKNPKIILLGCTPEIRDMLYKYSVSLGAEVICVDMVEDMYKSMNRLIKYHNKKERFVKSNWINLKFPKNSIDIVIGDFVLSNVDNEFQAKFLQGINRILKNDGYFINRDCVIKDNLRFNTPDRMLKKYAKKVADKEITIKQANSWFANSILWASWFKSNNETDSLKYFKEEIEKLKKEVDMGTIEKIIFNKFLSSWWLMRDKYWTMHRLEDNKRIIKKYFKIERIKYSKDYDLAKVAPIYFLKPKN